MTARILVVDDVAANVKLLQARLMAEYFEVITASNGADALAICQAGKCDVVLLDVMMPGMDGYEVCRRLKADPRTVALPVILLTALDQPADRLQGLEAGADDFLNKPINDIALLTRVRSLSRLKTTTDELQMRVNTGHQMAATTGLAAKLPDGQGGRVLVVDDTPRSYERIVKRLSSEHTVSVVTNPQEALFRIADEAFDLVIVSFAMEGFDALRLCSQVRSLDRTRTVPLLLLVQPDDQEGLLRAIDIGVNDYIARPVDGGELLARARTQVRRKRLNDQLRDDVHATMEMAVRDGLTGLNNRRYFDNHMTTLFENASIGKRPLSVIMLDIDRFKSINDTHGHAAGDAVLKEFSKRIGKSVRDRDLACRYGGEEFVIAMPETDRELAFVVADRMRKEIAQHPFLINGGAQTLEVTVSAGVSALRDGDADASAILARADAGLYEAKRAGRNQVISRAA